MLILVRMKLCLPTLARGKASDPYIEVERSGHVTTQYTKHAFEK